MDLPDTAAPAVSRPLTVVLSLLTVFGPISMDLYLPVLPRLTHDLHTSTSAAQLTVTACLFGLAFGQLFAGTLSDRFGRRRPLMVGVVAYIVTSLLCAASPNVGCLIVSRFIQGLAGGVGIVIAQAAGRDLYVGARLIRYYGRLTVLAGLAAIIGPVLGGQLAAITDWRGVFLVLSGIGVLILAASAWVLRETLPLGSRVVGGVARTARDMRRLLGDRRFVGAVLVTGFSYAALFAYLAGATFLLQDIYGLSPQGYAYTFGLNSLGFMVFGYAAGRVCERWTDRAALLAGLGMTVAGSLGLLVTAVLHLPLATVVLSLFTLVGGTAVTTAPTTSLALADYPDIAGTASSFLGVARFAFGGFAAPLVGLGGSSAVALGVVTVISATLAAASYVAALGKQNRGRDLDAQVRTINATSTAAGVTQSAA